MSFFDVTIDGKPFTRKKLLKTENTIRCNTGVFCNKWRKTLKYQRRDVFKRY